MPLCPMYPFNGYIVMILWRYDLHPICSVCAAGKYSATATAASCTDCAAGKYSGTAAVSCTDCAAGKYSATAAAVSCTHCAADTTGCGGASGGLKWFFGLLGASCDATCASNGGACDAASLKVHDAVEANNIIALLAPSMCSCVNQGAKNCCQVSQLGFYYGGTGGASCLAEHRQACAYPNPSFADPLCDAANSNVRRFCSCIL